MKIDINALSKKIHFPIIQAQPTEKKRGFLSLIKSFFTFKRLYQVKKEYVLWCEYLNAYIYTPIDFLYDNASVPKILNGIFKSDGLLLLGSISHDFGYRYQGLILLDKEGFLFFKSMSRDEIDIVLMKLSAIESGLPKSSSLAKKTLSLAGGFTWRGHVKNKNVVGNDYPELF